MGGIYFSFFDTLLSIDLVTVDAFWLLRPVDCPPRGEVIFLLALAWI